MRKSVGIITQARMTSTRLPGKILKLAGGISLLEHHITRLRLSGYPVFIATTSNATDDIVIDFAKKHQISYYRGDEDNVLSRYYECATKYKLDIIVRVTSDCPLVDGALIKKGIEEYISENNPSVYLSNSIVRTFPRGFDFEIFSYDLLKEAYEKATLASDLEHVTPYINQNKSGNVIFKHILCKENKSDIRITVDTIEDYTLVKKLIEEYDASNLNADEIIRVVDINPSLKAINAHIEQKKL